MSVITCLLFYNIWNIVQV